MKVIDSELYLHLSRPNTSRGIVYKASGEVALNATYQIMVLCIDTLAENAEEWFVSGSTWYFVLVTHEMIPNAWYSVTGPRDILANNPCCIPRSNRKMATLDDG